ncbi:MFS transporter [Kaistia geumhonensis]|uniref:MFS family arabinose efflux permease n=1 Tax=Kaistia geumhonensis TaxID=410839 RepID=A0ABU0M8G7_9HYPH|nr:MFS transporter [Kaistia geumhonensis]MCX5477526.1 MFS transporter [Kaistia geumhonensis]MDQ0517267.1 putative MFS family arabinose efflux permease [Kaistia geumhonensis]
MTRSLNPHALFALVAGTTLLGIAGTDLVLPAVPSLPEAFGSSIERAQMVLAAYALGTLVGLLAFGELGARHDPRGLLVWSLGLFTLASFAAAFAPSMEWLVALRLAQGAFGAAPAVFAPGFIKGMFAEDRAAAAIGRLGSVEALAPALAPIAGASLLTLGGWQVSFFVLGGLGLVLTLTLVALSGRLPGRAEALERHKTYWTILSSRRFLRYALSQSFALGGLLVFVFGAPAVITGPLGLGIREFVILQVVGITSFIVGATLSSRLAVRFGVERVIVSGTALLAAAFLVLLLYAATGGTSLVVVVAIWIFVNLGFGVRGPVGFHQAIMAAEGDHSRGAALVVAGILATAAAGTALVAPFIALGLWPLALGGAVITGLATLLLGVLADRS